MPRRGVGSERLPTHPEVHAEFLRRHVGRYAPNAPSTPAPVAATPELTELVTEFIETIKKDDAMYSLFNLMLRQVNKDEKWAAADDNCHVYDLDHLYRALTSAISGPAEVYIAKDKQGNEIGEPLGLPIYLILDPLSNTSAAYDLFRKKEFNSAMKKLLDGWGEYFKDENSGSNCVLNTSETGWFGKHGLDELQLGLRGLSFEQTYGVKPEEAQAKYKSWDAFFTREFKDIKTVRPIKVPEHHTPLYNACDAFCFRLAHSVKLDDTFWLKGQNYTLYDMFGGDPQTTQESLSSPIKGTVLETTILPGTYFAALPDEGATKHDPHLWEATRGVIIMEPQDESSPIALVAFVAIGMMEVSTIDITVSKDGTEGKPKYVDVGDQLGIFHFGGSSFVTVIKPKDGYEVVFKDAENKDTS
ncbi:phosphatidylserine decarboxylase 1 [Tylopilus felleus]